MLHLWVRAEERPNEARVGLTPQGASALIAAGASVTVEESRQRALPIDAFRTAGCTVAPEGSWREAPSEVIVFGLKELPEEDLPLIHCHIMFGHAYKGQPAGLRLMQRFRAGGGMLYDLECLVDADGRRVAAFGHWAGYAGAAVSLAAWAAQERGETLGPVNRAADAAALRNDLALALEGLDSRPGVLIIGARGRVGRGAAALCRALGLRPTMWDMAETAHGGPFPQVLEHDIFLNCILAAPGCPVFVPGGAGSVPRRLRVIGDIACDPGSPFSPVPVYDRATDWAVPVRRVHDVPPLDVMAIDNLPALLPIESSQDFAGQLLPHLQRFEDPDNGVWQRARAMFDRHIAAVPA